MIPDPTIVRVFGIRDFHRTRGKMVKLETVGKLGMFLIFVRRDGALAPIAQGTVSSHGTIFASPGGRAMQAFVGQQSKLPSETLLKFFDLSIRLGRVLGNTIARG